ncbi:MAG TPA: sigma-70 family RNA polymerase sigma factor [Labilithrix sp.]|jgi:RNA polymerase sigma factor for flagellar operon FliA
MPSTATQPTLSEPTESDIREHMHLVNRIVAHFVRRLPRSVQREDLIAAGTLGLFFALRTSASNVKTHPDMFAAYARIRIRGAILDELRRHDWAPRRRKVKEEASNVIPFPSGRVPNVAPPVHVVGFDDLPPTVMLCEDTESPLDRFEAAVDKERLHEALEALPERERKIIQMRYFEGVPSKAIASAFGLSEARISQLHARATARLRAILEDSGGELELAA